MRAGWQESWLTEKQAGWQTGLLLAGRQVGSQKTGQLVDRLSFWQTCKLACRQVRVLADRQLAGELLGGQAADWQTVELADVG